MDCILLLVKPSYFLFFATDQSIWQELFWHCTSILDGTSSAQSLLAMHTGASKLQMIYDISYAQRSLFNNFWNQQLSMMDTNCWFCPLFSFSFISLETAKCIGFCCFCASLRPFVVCWPGETGAWNALGASWKDEGTTGYCYSEVARCLASKGSETGREEEQGIQGVGWAEFCKASEFDCFNAALRCLTCFWWLQWLQSKL